MHPLFFVAALALLILAVGLATWYSGRVLRTFIPPQNLLLTLPDNLLRLFLILVCIMLGLFLGPGPQPLGWNADHLPRDVALGIAVALVLFPALTWTGNAVARRWGPDMYDNRVLRAIVPINRLEWTGVVFALLGAAVLEELLFRSLALGGLGSLFSTGVPASPGVMAASPWVLAASPWVLAWPLSLIFGWMHSNQGAWGVVGTALTGLVLSALFLLSGSIYVPIITHWVLNIAEVTVAQRQGLRPLRFDAAARVKPAD